MKTVFISVYYFRNEPKFHKQTQKLLISLFICHTPGHNMFAVILLYPSFVCKRYPPFTPLCAQVWLGLPTYLAIADYGHRHFKTCII